MATEKNWGYEDVGTNLEDDKEFIKFLEVKAKLFHRMVELLENRIKIYENLSAQQAEFARKLREKGELSIEGYGWGLDDDFIKALLETEFHFRQSLEMTRSHQKSIRIDKVVVDYKKDKAQGKDKQPSDKGIEVR